MKKFQIAVIGSGNILEDSEEYLLARKLGKRLVDKDFIILCGGLKGVMKAVCEGAKESKKYSYGQTIGILPSLDKSSANPFVDIKISTGMSNARNQIIIASADAVIVVRGGAGTLSEISYAWQMNKTIIALKKSGGWAEKLANSKIDGSREEKIISASSVSDVLKYLEEILIRQLYQ